MEKNAKLRLAEESKDDILENSVKSKDDSSTAEDEISTDLTLCKQQSSVLYAKKGDTKVTLDDF